MSIPGALGEILTDDPGQGGHDQAKEGMRSVQYAISATR